MAGIPSLLYAICNHIDKHLLEEYFEGDLGVPALLLVSALISVVALPFLWYFSPESVIPKHWIHLVAFATVGLLHVALLWFYFMALNQEDTITVVIFYSLLPVLGLVTANIFLGETLLPKQVLAMAVTILGVLIVSIETKGGKIRFKLKAAALMFMASLCWALGDVVFKQVAIDESVWRALFWEHLILFLVGLLLFITKPGVRSEFRRVIGMNSRFIIGINITSEILYILANVIGAFPLLMVQVAAVHLVQAFQPVWVFIIALFLQYLGWSKGKMPVGQIVQKTVATIIAVYGMYLLAIYTPH